MKVALGIWVVLAENLPFVSSTHIPLGVTPLKVKRETDVPDSCPVTRPRCVGWWAKAGRQGGHLCFHKLP